MAFHADLHVHSKYSRATSPTCDLEGLSAWARKKGVAVVGTGDFTHPAWREELAEKLEPAGPGLFALGEESPARFMLSAEIATVYKEDGQTRRVHHLVCVPSFGHVRRIAGRLSTIGNLEADGRPILKLDSRDLLEVVLESGDGAMLIPAHIWTPWYSVLGSKSGFDSVEACYGDLSEHVFAVETGLSSDPPMNRRVSMLDRFQLVSSSDAHSPQRLGREACVFNCDMDYFVMRHALETGDGYGGTIEFFPKEGKYHLDGHRKCGVRLTPEETGRLGGICPVCGKPVVVGVMNRVCELADRADAPAGGRPFCSLIALTEVLAEIEGVGAQSKRVARLYETLVEQVGPELFILEEAPLEEIRRSGSEPLAEAIRRLRAGEVLREPGYDGEYGAIRLFAPEELS